ncbi:MAG: bifunctional hydroxymethylpyrimidine kinase/phosphomethylpyrimidine kinase [Deltaproteobacteria bacterium]|nr:bifunctional hydroxymethylpyrimidine kinase/phosphomethylpyrimidine kinase [Deltaproteobacteria bacterium]
MTGDGTISGVRIPKALTIAGSDSGGGAGIQADLKTFAALGVYGMSAITAVTAQNTCGVLGVEELSPAFVALQVEAVTTDIGVDAVKTGMLSSPAIVDAVAKCISRFSLPFPVVDPVMVAKGGAPLLADEAKEAVIKRLLPLAFAVTPNIPEAAALTGKSVTGTESMKEAARAIFGMGPKWVLVKGGHLEGKASDILFDGQNFYNFESERINTQNTHGTGCTLSAAIAACLARGMTAPEAVERAKEYVTFAIKNSLGIGHGHGPTHHFAELYRKANTGWF